jgi:predicted Zn-dependent protease
VRGGLLPAVEAALAELERSGLRHEVYAREGETHSLRWRAGQWERRHALQAGVACRLAGGGTAGFASAAGVAATAGREAARAALAARHPGPDPLPPRWALGSATVPAPPPAPTAGQLERFALELMDELGPRLTGVREVRLAAGWSRALLVTGEGFAGSAALSGVVVEVQASQGGLPPGFVHVAAPALGDGLLQRCAALVAELAGPPLPLFPPRRGLQDVLLAPGVAGPLLEALVELLQSRPRGRRQVASAWNLADARGGPDGLLPLPFDGEGLPSRRVPLLADGRVGALPLTWGEAGGDVRRAGGAVRASYADPPCRGPANLVMMAGALSPRELASCIDDGWRLHSLAGPVRVDAERDDLTLQATGVRLCHGEAVQAWPRVELRAGCGRLLAALDAAGADSASLSLGSAVTTPSLLFRQLELRQGEQ